MLGMSRLPWLRDSREREEDGWRQRERRLFVARPTTFSPHQSANGRWWPFRSDYFRALLTLSINTLNWSRSVAVKSLAE